MKKILLVVCMTVAVAVVAVGSAVYAVEDAVVVSVEGQVSMRNADARDWEPVLTGQPVNEGDGIRTGRNAVIDIGFADGSMISIEENAEGSIGKLKADNEKKIFQTEVNLDIGQVIAKIQKLKSKKSSFVIRTPSAVTAVRGTEFIVAVDISGETKVAVFDGEVGMAGYTPEGEVLQEVSVMENQEAFVEGEGEAPSEPAEMSPEMAKQSDKVKGLSSKAEEHKSKVVARKEQEKKEKKDKKVKEKEKKKEDKKKEKDKDEKEKKDDSKSGKKSGKKGDAMAELREEMREFVSEVKVDITEKQEITDEVQQAGKSEGRSMLDVHGNLVTVTQFIERPDSKTIRLVNLVSRPGGYKYFEKNEQPDIEQFMPYTGSNEARYDSLVMELELNQEIPREVSDWPSTFMGDSADGIEMVNGTLMLSNNESMLTMKFKDDGVSASSEDNGEGGGMPMPGEIYVEEKLEDSNGVKYWGNRLYVGMPKEPGEDALMNEDDIALGGAELKGDAMNTAINIWGGVTMGLFSKKPPVMEGEEELNGDWVNEYGWERNADFRFAGFALDDYSNIQGIEDMIDFDNIDPFNLMETLGNYSGEFILSGGFLNDSYNNIDLIIAPNKFLSIAKELVTAAPDLIQ